MMDRITNRDVRYFVGGQPAPEQPTYADLAARVGELEVELRQARAFVQKILDLQPEPPWRDYLEREAQEVLNKE